METGNTTLFDTDRCEKIRIDWTIYNPQEADEYSLDNGFDIDTDNPEWMIRLEFTWNNEEHAGDGAAFWETTRDELNQYLDYSDKDSRFRNPLCDFCSAVTHDLYTCDDCNRLMCQDCYDNGVECHC